MFYRTQVSKIIAGGVIDVQGKELSLIGNKLVNIGDLVWTDGRIVFGHIPIRGGSLVSAPQSGIPVLGDDLRGYFTSTGQYKSYPIAQDDWIVNSVKFFDHGAEALHDVKIIDVKIKKNGDEAIITEGLYDNARTFEWYHVGILILDSYVWTYGDMGEGTRLVPVEGPIAVNSMLGLDNYNVNVPVKLYVNDELQGTLDLSPYVQDTEKRVMTLADKFMQMSYDDDGVELNYVSYEGQDYHRYLTSETDDPKYQVTPRPDKPIIIHSRAHLLSATATDADNADNNFSGVIETAVYGYCFPYILPRFIYDPDRRRHLREFKAVPVGMTCFYHFDGSTPPNTEPAPFAWRYYGGLQNYMIVIGNDNIGSPEDAVFVDYVYGSSYYPLLAVADARDAGFSLSLFDGDDIQLEQNWEKLIPVGDGFYTLDKFCRLTFYDSRKNIIAQNIPVNDKCVYLDMQPAEYRLYLYLLYLNNAPDKLMCNVYKPDGSITTRDLVKIDGYILHPWQSSATTLRYIYKQTLPYLNGYFINNGNDDFELEDLTPLNFTPLFYQLKNGSYLYGVKDSKLYLHTTDGDQVVGDGIKNFRLQDLKIIARAKK